MNLSPQAGTVLAHLYSESHITSWQAEGVYSIRRLASRIDEIVAAGYDIHKEEARDRRGQRYIRYSLSAVQKRCARPLKPVRPRNPRLTLERVELALRHRGLCPCVRASVISYLKESA